MPIELTQDQIDRFHEDGTLAVDRLIDEATVERVTARYEPMFRGEFETGVRPDEVNWQEGRDSPDLTRQICCGWKGDRTIANVVLREDIGRACARLAGWPGARVHVDNVVWKPPHARPIGYHQDAAYLGWIDPAEMLSCWIALDDTTAEGGTIEHVRGSHRWAVPKPEGEFHGPTEYRKYMEKAAAAEGVEPEIVPIVVPRGGGAFHHGRTWHGSGFNNSERPRRSLVVHCISSEARYSDDKSNEGIAPIYRRYKRYGDAAMDENYFPILWTESGYRTPWLDEYVRSGEGLGDKAA
jgi:ectoine hydroxylase-related dioxygenase (phytanoyl-CoA dioxygenase family)